MFCQCNSRWKLTTNSLRLIVFPTTCVGCLSGETSMASVPIKPVLPFLCQFCIFCPYLTYPFSVLICLTSSFNSSAPSMRSALYVKLFISLDAQTRPLVVQIQEQFFVTSASVSVDTREHNFYRLINRPSPCTARPVPEQYLDTSHDWFSLHVVLSTAQD
jgi:hypothetical protein